MEHLTDGTELHLASWRFANASIALEGQDHPDFAALKAEFANVLAEAPPGLPLERGIELVLEIGNRPIPRTRPIKRLSEGELAGLRRQLTDLLALGWIQHSVRAETGRVVAHLLILPGPPSQHHYGASRGAAAAHRRPPGRDVSPPPVSQGPGRVVVLAQQRLCCGCLVRF